MVLAAAILSLTPFVVIAWGVWEVRRTVAVARDRSLAVQELIGRIDYLDEGLSSTARLSAATGERRWEDRYVRLEDEVYAAIDSLDRVASAVGAPGIGDSILAVADSLASIEHAAFALARAGALAEARALLETPAYGEEKASYLRLREALLAELGAFTRDAEQETERRLLGILVFSASSLGILLFVWVFATRRVQRHMARRERAEAELRDRVVERRRLEEDLRKVESNLRAIVDVAPLAIVRVDNERRVQFWNPAAERIFGWSAEEVLGRPYPLEAPEDGGDVEALFDRGFGGENLEGVELRRLRKDGSEVHLRMWNASIREGGELRGLVGIFADVTEQRVLEHQLRQAQKLEAVGRLAGGIAHDFNNILTAVRGHAELMLEDAGPVLREGLKEIGASADRAAELTRQLLAFSRQQVLQPRVLDLASVVQDVESLLRRVIGEHIRLELDVREGTGSIRADPTQIEQVLVNLAVNARDAMPGGGRLTFAVDAPEFQPDEPQGHPDPVPPGRYVRLTVSDTGEGMDAGTMGRMFDPFFTTKKTSQGTGLGLATVFGIVTQSGGLIRVHSQVGRGTEFQILFPPVAAAPHPPAEAPPPKRERPPAEGTILLVEDDDPVRRIARRVLERQGYHVLEAATPGSALRIAEETPGIDLLLTDIVMPGLDGAELAARIEERCPDIRILFMSGYTEDEMVRADIATGPAHFLPKPFGRLELETAVGNVLRRE